MNIIPTIIEKTNTTEYAYDLYSRLLKDRIIFVSGEINNQLANIVISELLYLDSISHEDIYMYINSPGGEVTSGLAIYDTMNYIKSDVRTISVGLSASMGAFLLSAGTKGKRYSLKNSQIMIHQVLGGASGKASDIEIHTKYILSLKNKINKIIAQNTNNKLSKVEKDTKDDNFMNAEEALKYGLIDEII